MSATIHHGNLIPVRRELRPLKRYRVLPTSVSLVTRVFLRSTASFSKCFTFFQLLLRRWIRPVWGQDPCVRHPVASTDPGSTSPASGRRRELSHHAALRAWGGERKQCLGGNVFWPDHKYQTGHPLREPHRQCWGWWARPAGVLSPVRPRA